MRQVLIIGDHPVKNSIIKQYVSSGIENIGECNIEVSVFPNVKKVEEFVILSSSASGIDGDKEALVALNRLAAQLVDTNVRPVVHMLLQSHETMSLINTRDYNDDWHNKLELNVFTMDDVWAKNIVCTNAINTRMRGLDYKPVSLESNHTVHLVVFGIDSLATALVENSALTAHYPNYTRNHTLRTRITVINDRIDEWSKVFLSRHKPLMENSYYRMVDVQKKLHDLHKPMYEGKREDFVDIEWEFVKGSIHNLEVQDKLHGWATDGNQVLSVAICHESDEENLSQAGIAAEILCEYEVPIYVKQNSSVFSDIVMQSSRMKNVIMVGMKDYGYDVSLPLLKMAKRVNYVYEYCYNNNIASQTEGCITAPSYIDDKEADVCWLRVKKAIKRYSNICNAMTLATKMRSLGHSADETDTFYAITKQEIGIISEVEHNRWNVEELLLGFRPCTDEEQAGIEADVSKKGEYKNHLVHYDLRAYADLRADDTGKNVNTYDICLSASIPLIVYQDKKGGKV